MEFSEGLAPVLIDGKWGYVNAKGEVVIKPRWVPHDRYEMGTAYPFTKEGLALVVEYATWAEDGDSYFCGYIDKTGEYVIKPQLRRECRSFSEGLAWIVLDERDSSGQRIPKKELNWAGYIDTKGEWAIKPTLYQGSDFKRGVARVRKYAYSNYSDPDANWFFIDKSGRQVSEDKGCHLKYRFNEGLALAYSENKKSNDGFVSENCDYVFKFAPGIKAGPEYATYFSEGLVVVAKTVDGELRYGYLDRAGMIAIPFQFAQAIPFSDGLAFVKVKEGDKTFNAYIDRSGKIVLRDDKEVHLLPFSGNFKNGLLFRTLKIRTISERPNFRNIYGYMNKQGKFVWLSPDSEKHLDADWIKANYVGP
jgi:hypothetical protein